MKILPLLLLSLCYSLSALSTAATTQLDVVYVPKDVATAAPTTEETLERHACVFTTTSPAEIQRIQSLLDTAPRTTIDLPRPWYRAAIFLHDSRHGTIKYFFHVLRDEHSIPLRTLAGDSATMNSIPLSVAEEIFHKIPRAQYTLSNQHRRMSYCPEFIPAF